MSRRSWVIRVLPAPVWILPIRLRLAGAEASLGRRARGGAVDGWARGGAGCARVGRRWFGHDAVSFRERGTLPRPGHRYDSGRDTAGWGTARR